MDNLRELTNKEKRELNGGSEITDAIWFGIGFAVSHVINTTKLIYSTGLFSPKIL